MTNASQDPNPNPEPGSAAGRPVVLMTGAAGLIGARVGRDLARDHVVVGLDVEQPADDAPFEVLEADLTDEASLRQALEEVRRRHGARLASVVHLAAYYDFSGEPSPLYDELTVGGTRRLLRALQAFEVEQFVFSSSLLVMKPVAVGELLDEDSATQAEWAYPRSKLEAEAVMRAERGSIPIVSLRLAGVYDEAGHSLPIAQQMARIYERKLESYLFPGDASHGQSFLHLDDLVACFRATIEHREALGEDETFLVGEPDVVPYSEIQDTLGVALHGKRWPTIRIPAPVAKVGAWVEGKLPGNDDMFIKPWMIDLADAHYPVSIERAAERLGFVPEHHLRSTLPAMAQDLLDDPAAWYRRNGLEAPGDVAADAGGGSGRSDG